MFAREDGQPLHPETVSAQFARHAAAAGLERIRLHDLRHSYASAALAAGVHVNVVSEQLGHSSVALTLDTYSHVIPALPRRAAERVAALLDRSVSQRLADSRRSTPPNPAGFRLPK